MVERASGAHASITGKAAVHRRGLVDPPVDVPAPVRGDDVDGGIDQFRSDCCHLVPVVRMDNQLERIGVVAPRYLSVCNWMIVTGLRCKQPGKTVMSAIDQVEVEVVRQRPPPIGARCSVKKFVYCGDVVIFHLTLDLKKSHYQRLPAAGSGPFAQVELSGWTLGMEGSNV